MPNTQASKVMSLVTFPMLIIFALKLLFIWYFTSRIYMNAHGAILGYPYDSLVFTTFDRFTDWLMPAEQAWVVNPYNLAALHAAGVIAVAMPIGYLTFLLFRVADVFGPCAGFFLSIGAYAYLNFRIFRKRFKGDLLLCLTAFASLLIACYPLYLEIDRGNPVIWEAVLLSMVFLGFARKTTQWRFACILAAVACIKPSFGLFLIPVLAVAGVAQILAALAIVTVNYAIPIFLPGGGPYYLINAIKNASAILGPVSTFCHNFSCGLRAIGAPPLDPLVVILFLALLLFIAYRVRISRDSWKHAPLLVILTTLTSLLIADPSSDYALTLMLPIFLYLLRHELLNCEPATLWRSSAPYLIIGFILAMSFINMPFPDVPRLEAPLRSLGIIAWYIAIFRYIFRTSRSECGKSGTFTLRSDTDDALASPEPGNGREAVV